MPEFADQRLRYLQVSLEDSSETELKIQTAGASIRFDGDGKMAEAGPPADHENISRFEHDACGVSFICQIKGVASRSIRHHAGSSSRTSRRP
mgnify:CR=1 FL=1